jgi:hypothetical protein
LLTYRTSSDSAPLQSRGDRLRFLRILVLKRVVDMVRPPFGSAAGGRRADRSCAFRRGKNGVRFDAAKNNPRSPAQCLSFDKQTMRPANGSCQQ